MLLQDEKPITFASRSMTETETRYANIEKELLAILFGLARFHQYIYGKHVIVESDHKPLEAIIKKPLANTPPRLQRMLLRLQTYDFSVSNKPGKLLVVPEIETEKDDKLSIVRQFIREGWPENKYDIPNKIYEYWNCKYELTESKGVVLKGEKDSYTN
jgi:hypothetical protein